MYSIIAIVCSLAFTDCTSVVPANKEGMRFFKSLKECNEFISYNIDTLDKKGLYLDAQCINWERV